MDADKKDDVLTVAGAILLRCLIFSVALVTFWFLFYLAAGDWAYSVHARWFDLTRHEFVLMNYFGMAFVKLVAIVFFLFPYLAIRMTVGKRP
jgi:hypothetical protein